MPTQINISATPNQSVEFSYGDNSFAFHIFFYDKFTFLDMSINGEDILNGKICTPNTLLLHPNVVEAYNIGGNFIFDCKDEEYPFYGEFNKTQSFQFLTQEEADLIESV